MGILLILLDKKEKGVFDWGNLHGFEKNNPVHFKPQHGNLMPHKTAYPKKCQ